jgi:hypothetical protein
MESSAWTNERLDDLSRGVDRGFAQVDSRFAQVNQDIRDLRKEMRDGFQAINGLLFRIGGSIIVALIGVIGAILATGT